MPQVPQHTYHEGRAACSQCLDCVSPVAEPAPPARTADSPAPAAGAPAALGLPTHCCTFHLLARRMAHGLGQHLLVGVAEDLSGAPMAMVPSVGMLLQLRLGWVQAGCAPGWPLGIQSAGSLPSAPAALWSAGSSQCPPPGFCRESHLPYTTGLSPEARVSHCREAAASRLLRGILVRGAQG